MPLLEPWAKIDQVSKLNGRQNILLLSIELFPRFVGGQNVMSSQKLDVACVDTYKPKQGPIADSVSEMKNTNTDKDVNMNLWGNSIIGGEQEVRS